MKHLVLAVLLAISSTALADTAKKDDVVSEVDAAKFLAFFDKIVDAAVADKGSCDKMASDIAAIIDANKDVVAAASKAKAAGKQLPAAAKQHVMDGVNKMLPAVQDCSSNDKVKAAFEKLDLKKS